jgi:hypothetical protein
MDTRSSSPESIAAHHLPPSSPEVKKAWSYTSTPQYAFMSWCLTKAQGATDDDDDNYNSLCYMKSEITAVLIQVLNFHCNITPNRTVISQML